MENLNETLQRNYEAIVDRGLITPKTSLKAFKEKIIEEFKEVIEAITNYDDQPNIHAIEELGDLINVCNNTLIFFGHNPEDVLKAIARKNEKRANELRKNNKQH